MSARSFDSESSSVSPQSIHPLVDEVVMPMESSANPTPLLGVDVPSDHVVLLPIQPLVEEVVEPMKSSVNPTLLLESVESTKVVTSMQSSTDSTLLLESVESTKVVTLKQSSFDPILLFKSVESTKVVTAMQSSIDPTLLLEIVESTKLVMSMQYLVDPTLLRGSDVSIDYAFSISNSVLSNQGGIPLTSSTPPPSLRMVSFYWNDLVEPCVPSSGPFEIRVEVNTKKFTNVL
jgi:hypothetical protein